MKLAYVVVTIAIGVATGLAVLLAFARVGHARRVGLYPAKGKASMDDVRRLASSGHVTLAISAYREVHHVGLKEAKRAVEGIVASGGRVE